MLTPLMQQALNIFHTHFGYQAEHLLQAPGRVNLIGEHTDYNDGFVMPCAIDYSMVAAAKKRNDNFINIYSGNFHVAMQINLAEPIRPTKTQWENYPRGVVFYLQEQGHKISGADIVLVGDVPQGGGLSSSAALEVVVAQTFKTLYNLTVTGPEMARIGQLTEHHFIGTMCGIMDQMISACGQKDSAMLLDCRTFEQKFAAIPAGYDLLIINSNVKHNLVDSEYNQRREQCYKAAEILGVKALRDATLPQLDAAFADKASLVYKRAHHVISEDERTVAFAEALAKSDITTAGQLMYASHASMRDDFAITIPEIDFLFEELKGLVGQQGGARMTGGGFGGCCIALLPTNLTKSVSNTIVKHYKEKFGNKASVYVCQPQLGAHEVDLAATTEERLQA